MNQPPPSNVVPLRKIGEVAETGQTVLGRKPSTGARKRALKKGHRVAMVDFDVLSRVEMTGAEWHVFNTIVRFIPDKGGIEARVTVHEIAQRLDMKSSNVSRIISDLVKRDLILRGPSRGIWEVNPHLLYNGEFIEWNDVLTSYIQPQVTR